MNRIITTALLAASAALTGHAFADDITPSEPAFQSSRTREEVRAEYIASRDEVAALTGEDSGAFALAQQRQQSSAQLAGNNGNAAAN